MWIQDDSSGYRWLQISQFLQQERLPEADAESAGPEAPGRKPMEAPYVGCHCPCIPCQQVDPQGGVTYQDETVERDGKPEEQGQSWQEAWMPWAVASVAFWPRN